MQRKQETRMLNNKKNTIMKEFLLILTISLDNMLLYSYLSGIDNLLLGVITTVLIAASIYPIYRLIKELKD